MTPVGEWASDKGGDFEIDHFLIGPKWMFWCLHRLYVPRKGLL